MIQYKVMDVHLVQFHCQNVIQCHVVHIIRNRVCRSPFFKLYPTPEREGHHSSHYSFVFTNTCASWQIPVLVDFTKRHCPYFLFLSSIWLSNPWAPNNQMRNS